MKQHILSCVVFPLIFYIGCYALAIENADKTPNLDHRMGTIIVKTAPGLKVTVRQISHEFWFGSAVNRKIFISEEFLEDREKYLTILKENFNSAVHENAMKWHSTEKNQGDISYREADLVFKWCAENGLRMRGHCVFWAVDQYVQDWVKKLDDHSLRLAIEARAKGLVSHYRGRIDEFDVNNEMVHGNFYERRLGESIRKDMFLWCKEANPDAILYVNDYGILSGGDLEKYDKQIEALLAQGAPVGGIGLQGHFGETVDPLKVKNVLDRLSRFNLPIRITEFDMKTLNEEAKARGLETLYRAGFEHPSVQGILMWGFWAKRHWLSSQKHGIEGYTALWDKDWNPTPAAKAYRDLVFKEWWTDFEGVADEQGVCEVKAFLGRHKAAIPGAEKVVDLKKPHTRIEVVLSTQP